MTTSTPPPSQPANTVPTTLAANLAAEHPLLKSAPEDTAPEVSTKAITVMAVDDTPANLHLLIKMLTPQGYHIRPIPDGSSALASAAANPPDIILLDVQMPGLTGYEVCQRLKADERTCDIPVIFLTVLDDVADIVKGFEVGGVDYITKPVRAEELLARIKNQVALRSLQQQLSEKNKQQQKLLTQYEVTAIALRESEAKFSRAFQNTPLPTTIVDFQNEQYIDVNQAFIEHSGYSREEIIGHTAIELNIWQSLKQREIIFGQLKSQGYSHGVEVRFRTKSGGIKFAILFLTLVQFNDGVYILGAAQDMTQHKANQKQLMAQTQALSQTLETLQTTQAELIRSAKMAALGNLVAGIAHEINTPVGTAVMTASTLENATKSIVADLQQDTLKRSSFESYLEVATECSHLILNNLNRAGELINSFKEVAVDQTSLQKRTFLLKPYLHEVIANLTPQFKRTPHKIQLFGDDALLIESYPGSIAQVISNLTLNSLMHAFSESQPGTISITAEAQAESIVLTYHDDGCGINAANQSRIFEPFFTTARELGGSGLGLHLVYNLVTQTLRGHIQLESSSGQGATFTITFPRD